MKKQLIVVGIVVFIFAVWLSGCIGEPEEKLPLSIISFNVEPNTINQGESANLSWVVKGASSVNIDNGIGDVALTGSQVITPNETATYILTAVNSTTSKTSSTQIIVLTTPTTLTMEIDNWNDSENSIVWSVTGIYGDPLGWGEGKFGYVLLDESGVDQIFYAAVWTNDTDQDAHVTVGDTFTIIAGSDGYYTWSIVHRTLEYAIYEGSETKY